MVDILQHIGGEVIMVGQQEIAMEEAAFGQDDVVEAMPGRHGPGGVVEVGGFVTGVY